VSTFPAIGIGGHGWSGKCRGGCYDNRRRIERGGSAKAKTESVADYLHFHHHHR